MNNIVVMAFTAKGYGLAQTICDLLHKSKAEGHEKYKIIKAYRVKNVREFTAGHFVKGNVLLFVGAVGIAVRAVAPYVKSKTTDPAVIVVDEAGKYVIPILSGHIGGANEFALKLAGLLKASPVITTATDINNVFAVDKFAAENGYYIFNPERIKDISSALLEQREVGLSTAFEVTGGLPKGITVKDSGDTGIAIVPDLKECENTGKLFERTLYLLPKAYHVGVGAKKNTDTEMLEDFFLKILKESSVPLECISSLSSIDLKKDEQAICALAKKYNIPYITYSAEELEPYESLFKTSEFVKKITGAGSVCEASAYLTSKKGDCIRKKTSENGMTLAIFKEDWRVCFENIHGRAGS